MTNIESGRNPVRRVNLNDLIYILGMDVGEYKVFLQLRGLEFMPCEEIKGVDEIKKYLDYQVVAMDREFNITIRNDKLF